MSRKNIDFPTLVEVVNDLGNIFTIKDVSEDQRTKTANKKYLYHSHYHAFVGGALSDHRAELNIIEIQKGTTRGSKWQKAGSLYGGNYVDNHSIKTFTNIVSDYGINTPIAKKNTKEYAIEQINREIYSINSEIEKLQKNGDNWGCGCISIFVGVTFIITGVLLIFMGMGPVAIGFFIMSIILVFVGFISFVPSPQVNSLKKRIKTLEEKKKRV